ncbi:1-acyl-sn-glycerol-3-phosphate acyltransferase [Tuwongella immobilis]|uniref:Phospholipid/glycerol acyltransferase domain-containing protein n=1 Tax=Tuwongella immobilis TaxID=692036 RepID=A0A6C2YUK8_9BACT|nr:1-acyl-sn-glycerol-3-phosphate acyltransferase [Tuwongella immobilis]VIP04552.1 glycerol acyltransferase : Glycerol acyltransferase OS=Halomonas sp. BC04 GN=Q427_10115 PE=4 SV=1: Acyltransferase [Tuwongella immobilis]VTS06465.1 glycerol acyltransferase : Glycerol acyltransferase OS=Halomonas sp. BC04 GN=Q427_10115 PE=4 SV=1: Acyltransferase [Tuwongella immobilis]
MTPGEPAAPKQLTLLWLAFLTRVLAENALRFFVLLQVLPTLDAEANTSVHPMLVPLLMVVALSCGPAILFAPLIGRIITPTTINSAIIGSAAVSVVAMILGFALPNFWPGALGLLAIAGCFFGPARQQAIVQLQPKLRNSIAVLQMSFVLFGVLGTIGGWLLGANYGYEIRENLFGTPALALGLLIVHMTICLWIRIPAEIVDASGEPASRGFFRDSVRIFRDFDSRLAIGTLMILVMVVLASFVQIITQNPDAGLDFRELANVGFLALGALVASIEPHVHRTRAWIPFGFIGMAVCGLWLLTGSPWTMPAYWFSAGIILVPVLTAWFVGVRPPLRPHGYALLQAMLGITAIATVGTLVLVFPGAGSLEGLTVTQVDDIRVNYLGECRLVLAWAIFGTLVFASVTMFCFYSRPIVESIVNILMIPGYRVETVGPGLEVMPFRGPALILPNHAAWFDPLWLTKVLPCRNTPMMTSSFYDLPVISYLMRRVVQGIRVPDVPFRREAPELQEAIDALHRNDPVVVFPEGYLRRSEAKVLRRFGQGIWQILRAKPDTPIYLCWIEGGWGSWTSFKDGPPMVNKKMDFQLKVQLAFAAPFVVPPEVLESHMRTRVYLMEKLLEVRSLLGLPVLTVDEVNRSGNDESNSGESESNRS